MDTRMDTRLGIEIVDRRNLLTTAAGAAALLALFAAGAGAQEKSVATEFDDAFKKIVGDAKPVEGKALTLDVPEIAENGNTVPFTLAVESPMTEKDFVKAIHILSTGNPQPGIASFTFTPQSGKATASSRMRLAKTQDVVALAELSDGRFLVGRRTIKVTIGGCGG